MINKKPTRGIARLKYLITVPLVALLTLLNNLPAKSIAMNVDGIINTEMILIPTLPQDGRKVYEVVEEMPKYPGGETALQEFVSKNVRYPLKAQTKGVQGRVIAQFIIDEQGKVNDVKLRNSVSPEIDAEAIRVIKSMPRWTPGKQGGKVVAVRYTIPVNFNLTGINKADNNDGQTVRVISSGKGEDSKEWQEYVNRKQFAEVTNRIVEPADSLDFAKMYAMAQAYEGLLKYGQALEYFTLCRRIDSTRTDALYAVARISANLGKAADAARYYNKALNADSSDFYARHQLARLYYSQEDFDNALFHYRLLLQSDTANSSILINIADCHTKKEELLSAAHYYRQAISINPENPLLGDALVNTLLKIGGASAQEALGVCDIALAHNPHSRALRRDKGMALFVNKMYNEADTIFTSLLAEGDSSYLVLAYCGYARYYAAQFMNSIDVLEPAYLIAPSSVDICLTLGAALGRTYDRQRAYLMLDKAEQLMQPDSTRLIILKSARAETLHRDGKYTEAATLYYELWKDNNDRIKYLQAIAGFYPLLTNIKDEPTRRKALFIHVLLAREAPKANIPTQQLQQTRRFLEDYIQETFLKAEDTAVMLSLDGQRSSITTAKLRELLISIP